MSRLEHAATHPVQHPAPVADDVPAFESAPDRWVKPMVAISQSDLATLAAALAAAKAARSKADNAFATLRCKLAEFEEVLTRIKIQEISAA